MARTLLISAALAALLLAPASPLGETTHTVAPGQTLGKIAKRYRISVDDLRAANDLKPGEAIKPGQELQIPEPGAAAHAKAKLGSAHGAQASRGEGDYARRPKRPGVVHMVRGDDHFDGLLIGKKGKLNAPALPGLSNILRFAPNGAKVSIDPRLATLIGMVSDHFGGRTLHVVSGYRPYSPTQYTPHSNHNVGRAIDFFVEGVPNTVLRDYCRQFKDAGVGFYPNSSFVHLDVRAGQTYWGSTTPRLAKLPATTVPPRPFRPTKLGATWTPARRTLVRNQTTTDGVRGSEYTQ